MDQLIGFGFGLVLALLSYPLGLLSGRRRAEEEHAKRRKQVALGFLFECKTLEKLLRLIAEDDGPLDSKWQVTSPLMDALKAEAILLKPKTASDFLNFYSLLQDVAIWRDWHNANEKTTDYENWVVRAKTYFALKALALLKESLETEGAHIDANEARKQIIFPHIPALPYPLISQRC